MNLVLVYNPASGSSLPASELKKRFKNAGHTILELIDVTKDLEGKLAPYLDDSSTVVAAFGGDGTLSSVAAVLVGTGVPFAPLPGGTLNHFTKDLGISQELEDALIHLSLKSVRLIDVATVNDRVFINNSSIGLYPSTLKARGELEHQKKYHKWIAAVIANLKALIRYRLLTVDIKGEHYKTPFVFIGNNDYHLDRDLIGNRENVNNHILSVYAIDSPYRLAALKILLLSLIGQAAQVPELKVWKTKEITIYTKRHAVHISRDGEREKVSSPLHY